LADLRPERADAVVVGARCAGSAAAIALARGGRRVVAIDRARFPSDTLSTHMLWPGGVVELKRLGALERVEALGAPHLPEGLAAWDGHEIRGGYTPIDGIDYALCVRRPGFDAALVATARAAGAEVRERCVARALLCRNGRVAGVRYRDAGGSERELHAPLVIGADGRRSLIARELEIEAPGLAQDSGRGCYFAYWEDAQPRWRGLAAQWRHDEELVTAFPCDGGLVMVLLMPPVERGGAFKRDLEGEYERTVAAVPALAARLAGCRRRTKVRHTPMTTSYFRRSAGPGWALAGDAGHFKDPVTAQGIRDAMRFGRLLGEAVVPHLGDERALDGALTGWERRRDRECLEAYQWTNLVGRAETMNPIEAELYRVAAGDRKLARSFLDVFARTIPPAEVMTLRRLVGLTARALTRGRANRVEALRIAWRELRAGIARRAERQELLSGRPLGLGLSHPRPELSGPVTNRLDHARDRGAVRRSRLVFLAKELDPTRSR
jgi:flavin-dependent dehydrogenase